MAKTAKAKKTAQGTKTAKKRKPKDKDTPKQPLSAYFFFSKEKRAEVKEKHPEFKPTQIIKELSIQWITLDIDKKEKYQILSNQDRDRYQEEKKKKKK